MKDYESVITNSPEPSNGNVVFYRLSTSAASIFAYISDCMFANKKRFTIF